MLKVTSENAFETYLEEILFEKSGWHKLPKAGWDKANAYFPKEVIAFIQRTQLPLWQQMEKLHGAELEPKLLDTLLKELDLKGTLHVLRHGFKFYGKNFRMAYFRPAHGLNPEVLSLYAENHLSVTRQVPCHPNDGSSIDLTFCLNGLPVATCELKNPGTHQTWRDAVHQYQTDRDPNAPLFRYQKRALVHFAADVDEVRMATKLARDKTFFLPFNRGSHPGEVQCGAGNPQHASGYRTGYFWEEVLAGAAHATVSDNIVVLHHKEGIPLIIRPGWTMAYFMKDKSSADAVRDGSLDYLMFPFARRTFFMSSEEPSITRIWRKAPKEYLAAIEATVKSEIYVDMLSVRPGYRNNHVATLLMDAIRENWPDLKVRTSHRTPNGEAFFREYLPGTPQD